VKEKMMKRTKKSKKPRPHAASQPKVKRFRKIAGLAVLGLICALAPTLVIFWPKAAADQAPKLSAAIAAIETGFVRLEEMVRSGQAHLSAPLKESALAPFELVRANQGNPIKNRIVFNRQAPNERRQIRLDSRYFFYDLLSPADSRKHGCSAAFSPSSRRLLVDGDIDGSLYELLIVYHECFHVLSDNQERDKLKTGDDIRQYGDFFIREVNRTEYRIILDWEIAANIFELEATNALLGGRLKQKNISPQQVARLIGAPRDKLGNIEFLLKLADAYFPQGLGLDGKPSKEFTRLIISICRQGGRQVVEYGPERSFKTVREVDLKAYGF
jgi:hypothetical protein